MIPTPGSKIGHTRGCILHSTDSAHRRGHVLPSVVPVPSRFTVAHLSADILQEVVRHLDARATCALSCTCRLFHAICSEAAPFLRLSLYPHQVSSRLSCLLAFTNPNQEMSDVLSQSEMGGAASCIAMDAGAREGGKSDATPDMAVLPDKGRVAVMGLCGYRQHPH